MTPPPPQPIPRIVPVLTSLVQSYGLDSLDNADGPASDAKPRSGGMTHLEHFGDGKRAGLYRLVRHPSYTGLLVAFLGLGVFFANWLSIFGLLGCFSAALSKAPDQRLRRTVARFRFAPPLNRTEHRPRFRGAGDGATRHPDDPGAYFFFGGVLGVGWGFG